jgi:hypothetical protein
MDKLGRCARVHRLAGHEGFPAARGDAQAHVGDARHLFHRSLWQTLSFMDLRRNGGERLLRLLHRPAFLIISLQPVQRVFLILFGRHQFVILEGRLRVNG